MNWVGIGPPAEWNYNLFGDLWKFLWPFVAAVVWWVWSDSTGRTQRKAIERMEQRKLDRRDKAMAALGLGPHARKARREGNTAARTGAGHLEESQDRDLSRRDEPRL